MESDNHNNIVMATTEDVEVVEAVEEVEEVPFTEEEIAITYKVLGVLANRNDLLEQRNMRMLRKKLAPVCEYIEGRKFGGIGRKKYLEDKAIREEKRARHNRRKMHDRRHINSSTLRRERIAKLESLLLQGDDATSVLPMIADGVAGDYGCYATNTLLTSISDSKLQQLCTDEAQQARHDEVAAYSKEANALLGFRSCYTCKSRFDKIHHFYDQLCPRCSELNFIKRFQTADLRGKVALITGARVKIGFQAAVKLLLAGAAVIVTTRFPKDAAERFAKHSEYETFKGRLHIFGIDFRDLVHLEQFCDFVISRYSRLDMIVHNACQTVRRPPAYYKLLVDKETKALETSNKEVQMLLSCQQEFESHVKSVALSTSDVNAVNTGGNVVMSSALKSQVPLIAGEDHPDDQTFPKGIVDVNGQQLDLRSQNSWLLRMGEVATPEVAEVFAINTLAPFIMNNRLLPLLEKSGISEKKFIVNAALNMMTRTCAEDLSKRRIYMNSVDTGWINDENPLSKAHAYAEAHNFQTPIDEIDAAARVLDPIFVGYNSDESIFGKFLKDFHETECQISSVLNLPSRSIISSREKERKDEVLRHKLTKLRDERTDSRIFRHLLREVTFYLGYDATDDLETIPMKIKTPKGDHQGAELSTLVALVPILRAGLGMVEPMLDVLPNATVHHIGMYRNKQSLLPVQYYNKLPKECNVDVAIILEPVIATAGTILATLAVLKTWGVQRIKIVSTIASKQGLQEVCDKNPDVEIFLAAIDDGLSEDGYILPGLGDAGDREFHTGKQDEKVEMLQKKQKL
ncbi:unnamed protein product [Peronospora belbahrii]|uniref:uracil phosphoribosyltransferase n=1 Tax=Peronospora belbahrii TaxID=622444 RepID=A0AAU9LAU2_9STRA|nr:unnamed protein product [Peronospora belbahrii]